MRTTPVREHRHGPNQTHLQRRSAWLHHDLSQTTDDCYSTALRHSLLAGPM